MNTKLKRVIVTSFLGVLAIPSASAYGTGFGMMDSFLETISNFFRMEILQSHTVQEGLLRFLLFIVVFSMANMALKRAAKFEPRVAGAAGFAIAFIGVFFMPEEWIFATGGTITTVVSAALMLAILGTLIWFAVMKLTGDPVKHFIGIILLFMVLQLIYMYQTMIVPGVGIQRIELIPPIKMVLLLSKGMVDKWLQ